MPFIVPSFACAFVSSIPGVAGLAARRRAAAARSEALRLCAARAETTRSTAGRASASVASRSHAKISGVFTTSTSSSVWFHARTSFSRACASHRSAALRWSVHALAKASALPSVEALGTSAPRRSDQPSNDASSAAAMAADAVCCGSTIARVRGAGRAPSTTAGAIGGRSTGSAAAPPTGTRDGWLLRFADRVCEALGLLEVSMSRTYERC